MVIEVSFHSSAIGKTPVSLIWEEGHFTVYVTTYSWKEFSKNSKTGKTNE
tara:strand:- start:1527 stop:1676 length:150 start_codon:yes stop_codon:yes gene_type:complete